MATEKQAILVFDLVRKLPVEAVTEVIGNLLERVEAEQSALKVGA